MRLGLFFREVDDGNWNYFVFWDVDVIVDYYGFGLISFIVVRFFVLGFIVEVVVSVLFLDIL